MQFWKLYFTFTAHSNSHAKFCHVELDSYLDLRIYITKNEFYTLRLSQGYQKKAYNN